jgi:thioredoxin-dependent peroxiredoxin
MTTINEGDKAPRFSGVSQRGENINLELFSGKKVILYFYPKDNTPGCTAEACSLRDGYEELTQKGFVVIGVSPDSVKSHDGFAQKYNLPFYLISDLSKEILKAYGAWGMKKNYGKEYEGVIRKTFIIGEDGQIIKRIDKVDTKNHVAQILKLLEV